MATCLLHSNRYDETLEVVITYTEELAKYQALQADVEMKSGIFRSVLHGIPYGLKDLISVPSYPTTWGAGPFSDQVGCLALNLSSEMSAYLCALCTASASCI